MENSVIFMVLLQVILILMNAFFACAEIAVISMNDNKLAKLAAKGDKRAIRLARLTSQPARFLATIQVAITLSGFLGSAFAAENFSGVVVDWLLNLGVPVSPEVLDTLAVIFITIILSYFTLVFGELVPKQVAMRKSEPLALSLSGPIHGIEKLFSPLVSLLTLSTNAVLRIIGIDPNSEEDRVSEEEIRMMVDVGNEKGMIDNEEREFIQNVFEFDDLSVEEILTHRTDVVMLDLEDSEGVWEEAILNSRYTYYPVCEGSADRIFGILNSKDYFRLKDKSRESVLRNAVAPAYFVPETLKADKLFNNMKKERISIAVVLDEYGGMSGIVTLKDLIEELVGELNYDGKEAEIAIEKIEEGVWRIRGSALLEEVEEELGMSFTGESFETFNGLIFHALGNIPKDGIETGIETEGLIISEIEIRNHQIKTAIVKKQDGKGGNPETLKEDGH